MLYILLLVLAALPIIEIIGFITIGGDIGLGWSFLWLFAATVGGLHFLKNGSLPKQPLAQNDDQAAMQAMFDSLCLFGAGLLLIFPGFISDFLALSLALPLFRHWIFQRLIRESDMMFRHFSENGDYFVYRARHGHTAEKHDSVIEGEFHHLEDKKDR